MFSQSIEITIQKQNEDDQEEYQILKEEQKQLQKEMPIDSTISVKLNDTYIFITKEEASLLFTTESQWEQFLNKQLDQRHTSMSVIGLNSIINIYAEDQKRRKMIWNFIIKRVNKIQQNQVQFETNSKINREIEKNTIKMFKKLRINNENEVAYLKIVIIHIISRYHEKQPNLGSLKGLQYICYSIYLSSPNKNYEILYAIFQYLMQVQNLKSIFYPGNPLFYQELHILCSQLQIQVCSLYKCLDPKVDWSKIFIAYYRTLLMNKLTNLNVIIKILDLILICKQIVTFRWIRILSEKQKQLLSKGEDIIPFLGIDLVRDYFQGQLTKQNKFRQSLQEQQMQDQQESQIKQINTPPHKKQQIKNKQQDQRIIKLFRKLIIGI